MVVGFFVGIIFFFGCANSGPVAGILVILLALATLIFALKVFLKFITRD